METHEGTVEVKIIELHTISPENKLCIKKIFVHTTNYMIALSNTFYNNGHNLKVLRSLTRE